MTGSALVLLETAIDPSVVKPGWIPLLVTSLLLVSLVFLFLSMQKQMRKIRVPGDEQVEADEGEPQRAETDEPAQPESR